MCAAQRLMWLFGSLVGNLLTPFKGLCWSPQALTLTRIVLADPHSPRTANVKPQGEPG